MRTMILGCGVLAASIAGSANAHFVGWAANVSQAGEYGVMDVYAMFNDGGAPNDMLAVVDLALDPIGFSIFHQDNLGLPAWAPQLSYTADWVDSYLTIGYHAVPIDNPTHPVFGFGNWYGPDAILPPYGTPGPIEEPGWLNINGSSNPIFSVVVSLNLNDTGSDWGVFVGRFVILNPADGIRRAISFDAVAMWEEGLQSTRDVETFAYIPTPGASAMVALMALSGRRRRA